MSDEFLVFWDFDGVWADSDFFVYDYWRKAFHNRGIIFSFSDYQATFNSGSPFDYLRDNWAKDAVEIFEAYHIYEQENYSKMVSLYPKMKQLAPRLLGFGSNIIVSANQSEVIAGVLQNNLIAESFAQLMGRGQPGIKAEKIKKCCQKFSNHSVKNCLVGDSASDMQQGKKAGILTIGVTWGVHDRERLTAELPNFIVESPEELLDVLASL